MARTTILYALALFALGASTYFISESRHFTAAIPAVIGLPIFLFGLFAARAKNERGFIIAACVVSFLALLGSLGGPAKFLSLAGGGEVARPLAVVSQTITFVLSAAFLFGAFRWFRGSKGAT